MGPEPNDGKPAREERFFYAVLWLSVAGFIAGPVLLWLAGAGSAIGAFISAPLLLLLVMRFGRRAQR